MTHLEITLLNYLLNALWQVPVIFLVATLAARLTRSAGPHIEHRIWVAALVLEATLPACAFAPALRNLVLSLFQRDPGHITTQTTLLNATPTHNNAHLTAILASAALIVYIALLTYFTARLLYRLHRTRTLRRRRTHDPHRFLGRGRRRDRRHQPYDPRRKDPPRRRRDHRSPQDG